ncbi:hypothetical protein ISCGN_016420 [Ixodes scapularis]
MRLALDVALWTWGAKLRRLSRTTPRRVVEGTCFSSEPPRVKFEAWLVVFEVLEEIANVIATLLEQLKGNLFSADQRKHWSRSS